MPMQYLDAVDACYGALEPGGSFDTLIRALGDVVGAEAGDLVAEDTLTGEIRTFGSYGFDPVYRDLYDSEYLGANPWVAALEEGPRDRLRTDIEDRCGYRRTAYFGDWVRPQGFERSVGARLSALPGQTVWVGFVRGTGDRAFSGAGVGVLDALVPHLNRVVRLADRYGAAAAAGTSPVAGGTEPALLIGPDRRIIERNAAAEGAIDGDRLCRTRDDRLALGNRGDDALFRRALAAVVSGMDPEAQVAPPEGLVCLAHGRDGDVIALKLLPHSLVDPHLGTVRRVALVLVSDWRPEPLGPDLRPLALEFGLTPTECDLVSHLAAGKSLDSFAEARAMALSTARWHLKNAEAKTGTRRAEQLVALAHQRGFRRFRPADGG